MIKKRIIDSFEQEFAAYIGTKYAIGTSMGRTALFAVLKAIGVEENDEIIMPAYICEVVPNSVLKLNGVPIFVDINLTDYHISLSHLQSLINSKTKAIIINHIFGYPEDVDAIKEIIDKYEQKIFLIEDAAHALGAEYKGRKVGNLGDAAIFSFSKKLITIGGGAITTNNSLIAENIKKIVYASKDLHLINKIFFGILSYIDRSRINSKLSQKLMKFLEDFPKKFSLITKSYKEGLKIPNELMISPVQAFFILWQLKKIDEINKKCNSYQNVLDISLKECKKIDILKNDKEDSHHVCSWYIIIFNDEKLMKNVTYNLRQNNVFLSKFWEIPLIEQNGQYRQSVTDVPNSVKIARKTSVFKMSPNLSNNSITIISQKLIEELTKST